jgi:hypothetical protein
MQWKPGLILRIKDYKFEDDGSTRDGVPYYFIPARQPVGNENFYFDKDTFIFFQANIRKESYEKFERASKALWGVVSLGRLTDDELARIIKCALKSKFVPVNIMSELSAFKETL